MEGPVLAERTDIANRFDVDVIRITAADQHIAFVAGTDHRDANRVLDLAVAEVGRTEARAADRTGGHNASQKVAAIDVVVAADSRVIVIFTDFALFAGKFVDHGYVL